MLVFIRSRSQNARFNYVNCFFFSFKRERGGAVGAEDESVNLNGSAGHEIAPPPKRGLEQMKSSSLDRHRWTFERSALSGRMSCVIVSKACGRPGTLRSDQRTRAGRRIFRWCHFEFGIKLINRINAEMFFGRCSGSVYFVEPVRLWR